MGMKINKILVTLSYGYRMTLNSLSMLAIGIFSCTNTFVCEDAIEQVMIFSR